MSGERESEQIERVLYAHREDALTCYDHPPTLEQPSWCCVCGEHQVTIPWRWHVAHAVWQALEAAEREVEDDPRECGWLGCGHPRCEPFCAGVPLDEWRTWRERRTQPPPP